MPIHTGIPFAARSVVKSAGISTFETSQSQKIRAVDSHAKPKSRASSKCMRKWATAYLRTPGCPSGRRAYSPCPNVILRLTRPVQITSVASTPQNVSGLVVGQGSHARIFIDLRLLCDRSACRVFTPPSALDATVLTSSKLRFWHALEGKRMEEKTFTKGS